MHSFYMLLRLCSVLPQLCWYFDVWWRFMMLSPPRRGSRQLKCSASHFHMLDISSCNETALLLMSSQKLPAAHRSHQRSAALAFSSLCSAFYLRIFCLPLSLCVIDAWRRSQTEAVQTRLLCELLLILFHLSHNEVLVSLSECQQCLARQQVRRAPRL